MASDMVKNGGEEKVVGARGRTQGVNGGCRGKIPVLRGGTHAGVWR